MLEVRNKMLSSTRCSFRFPAAAKVSSFAFQVAPLSAEYSKLRCDTAHTCEPSAETSSDCAGCFTNSSLLGDFQVVPLSSETSRPPVVAAYQASFVNAMSLIKNAVSCGAGVFFFGAGRAAAVVVAPLRAFEVTGAATGAANGASGTYSPAFTHLFVVSSYFIHPPEVSEAHHPFGAA